MTIDERKTALKYISDNMREDADEGIFISYIDEFQRDFDDYEVLKTQKETFDSSEYETLKADHETLKANYARVNEKYNNLIATYKRRFFGITDTAVEQNGDGLKENEEPALTYENLFKI